MPRKTKEQTEKDNLEKKSSTKNTTKKDSAKSVAKKVSTKKSVAKSTQLDKKTASTTKKDTTAKKVASKSTTKKKSTTKSKKTTKAKIIPIVEYYDLPYRYNQTVVKLLAQTPSNLFVYWDISDEDRENYKKTYGNNFFEETKPVLIVHNNTLNYSFEVDINDFANSWYLQINDSKCDYSIELGRRPLPSSNTKIDTDYIYVSSSNEIEAPNDKILFNTDEHKVYFRNVKTNVTSTKSISFIKNMGKVYNIYNVYKTIYKEDIDNNSILEDITSSNFK